MDKLQLVFFFINGFFISRLIIKQHLPEKIIHFLFIRFNPSLSGILFILIATSAVLSFFIPNAITVLTLLPALDILIRLYTRERSKVATGSIATILGLALIYGANIGGMGSITSSPANGILVGFAELEQIPGRERLNFAEWLSWGIPLVFFSVIAAWGLLRLAVWREIKVHLDVGHERLELTTEHPLQKWGVGLTLFYFFTSLLLSVLLLLWPQSELNIIIATGIISLIIFAMLFAVPLATAQGKKVLLTIPDCYSNLPTKGFLFVGVVIILGGLAYYLDLAPILSDWFQPLLPRQLPPYFIFLALALLSSFTTEILSNTIVQMGMFALSLAIAETMPFSLLQAFIIISLSSTSAFMTPIATGVNGLAFGGVRQLSLGKMLAFGFFMNILGALIISGWIYNFL